MDTDTLPAPTSGTDAAQDMQSSAPPASSDWADAARQPAAPTATPGTGTIPDQATPSYTAPPVVITPQQPKGILGVVASVRDALTGTTRPTIGTDAEGNKYVKETTLTHGEQWRRIAGELGAGAAAGLAAGRGAGNMGKAAFAGVQQGEGIVDDQRQQQKDMSAEARQENLDNANNQMVKMQHAEQAFRATRLQVEATQKDIEFSQKQEDRLIAAGGTVVGTMTNPGDITKVLKVNPDVAKDLVQNHTIELINHYDADGKLDGIKVIKMPADHGSEMLPSGAVFHTFDPIKNEITEHHASDPMTAREQNNYDAAAVTAKNKFNADKKEQDLKQAEIEERKANADKAPSEIAKNNAEADKARADAAKARATDKDDPEIGTLGEAIARGALTEDQIPGFSKKKASIEAYLAEHHPNLDQKSVILDAAQRKQVNLARNAMHNLDDIATRLQRRPDLVGKINGLVTQGKELVGTDDRDLADINTALDNYALASTGAHGVRAVQARADAKAALLNHFKNGPNGVQAGMAAARGSLQNLASAGTPRGVNGDPYIYKTTPNAPPPPPTPGAVKIQPGEPTAKDAQGRTLVVRGNQWIVGQQ